MSNGPDKSSTPTPASPSSHAPPSATAATNPEYDYAHNNIVYTADPSSPNAPPLVTFPPDIQFTPAELALPAPELFRLLRRQLLWAQQEADELKAEADVLERKRKDEWIAKELLVENTMEAELARGLNKSDYSETEDREHVKKREGAKKMVTEDVNPGLLLEVEGKTPWWRQESLLRKQREEKTMKQINANADAPHTPGWHDGAQMGQVKPEEQAADRYEEQLEHRPEETHQGHPEERVVESVA